MTRSGPLQRNDIVIISLAFALITGHTDWYKCGRWLLCLEFADKILIFAVLKQWLLQDRETEVSFVYIIYNTMYKLVKHIITRIRISNAGVAFGRHRGVCSYRVRGVDGSCAKHLTVKSLRSYAANTVLLFRLLYFTVLYLC